MLVEGLLRRLPINRTAMGIRVAEVAAVQEVEYGNLAHEYLGLSVKISKDLKLPYHGEVAERIGQLHGCCHRARVDHFIDTYGGEDREDFKENNFRIADIAFLTHTQGAIEDIIERLEHGFFSRTEKKIAKERLSQLEENLYLGLQHVYTINGVKPKKNSDVLYDQFFNGVASEGVRRIIEIGKVIYRKRDLLYDANITDVSIILGDLSGQVENRSNFI